MENETIGNLRNGYDLPVYGLADGTFYNIHIPAMTCIAISFCCATAVIIASFRLKGFRTFFTWTKSERFVVYLAVCDLLFNVAHMMDHAHMAATVNHVYPKELCEFYGFMLLEFITAQNLMVNVIAINAFILIYFERNIELGRYDWRLLAWTFGAPFVGGIICGAMGQLGTNGAFCYFDGVNGKMAALFFTFIPLMIILVMNIILYVLTWYRIYRQEKQLKNALGLKAKAMRASFTVARNMSLFVVAFFAQWWAMTLYGIWNQIAPIPQLLFQFVTTFSNVGGILNGIVYIIIRRRQMLKQQSSLAEKLSDSYKSHPGSVNKSMKHDSAHAQETSGETTQSSAVEHQTVGKDENKFENHLGHQIGIATISKDENMCENEKDAVCLDMSRQI